VSIEAKFSKRVGSIFVDVLESKAGLKYIQITSSKKDANDQWVKTRIPVFADQLDPLCEALMECKAWL
jgi:hypothetical protein